MATKKDTSKDTPAAKPVDRVVMASRTADGTPVQSEGYEHIGDKEFVKAATAEQLTQIAVSADDNARAREQAAENAGSGETSLSPEEEERISRHQELQKAAAEQADAEVESRHSGVETAGGATPARSAPVETTATRSAAAPNGG